MVPTLRFRMEASSSQKERVNTEKISCFHFQHKKKKKTVTEIISNLRQFRSHR